MRTQLLLSLTCVLGAVACGSSSTNQQAANDPSTVQSTTTTGAAVNAPIVTAGSDTNESSMAIHNDPPAMNNGVVSNVGANQNFSGSTPQPVATGSVSAHLGATPIEPSRAPGTTGNATAPAASASGHSALTPMNQGNSKSETQITADIRKTVMADKSLSFTAKNVKIITQGTKVTLRGAVKSDAEKSSIETEARNTAGVTDVDDQIVIKP
jgi:osmotically-inducible protein OsmY